MPNINGELSKSEMEDRTDQWLEETGGRDEDYQTYMNGQSVSQQPEPLEQEDEGD